MRIDLVTRVLLSHSRNDDIVTTSARDARGYIYVRALTNKVLGTKSHTNIFYDSELESLSFRGLASSKNLGAIRRLP